MSLKKSSENLAETSVPQNEGSETLVELVKALRKDKELQETK